MSCTSVWTKVGVAFVIVCLCSLDLVSGAEKSLKRQKRGFRTNSASRVAHGYGKRGSFLSTAPVVDDFPLMEAKQNILEDAQEDILPKVSLLDLAAAARGLSEEITGSLATVDEFAALVAKHPSLARAIVKKFIDVDRDDVISTSELFRSAVKK